MKYDDIIEMDYPVSTRHARMSPEERAAQFAPFAALTGYESMVKDKARITESRREPDETQIAVLNRMIALIMERLQEKPEVSIEYFVKDRTKEGGRYESVKGRVQNVDISERAIVLKGGQKISLDNIYEIQLSD